MSSKHRFILILLWILSLCCLAEGWAPSKLKISYGTKKRLPLLRSLCLNSNPPDRPNYQELTNQCIAFAENHQEEQDALLKRDSKIYLIPIIVAVLAFNLFPWTSGAFHSTLETLSLGQYTGELSEDIRPLINGPVTLTISILFGSLVSMTISTLYQRQCELHRVGIARVNDCRHILYLAQALPEPERSRVITRVKVFCIQGLRSFFNGSLFDKTNRSFDLNPVLLDLHKTTEREKYNGLAIGELYAAINNLKEINIDFVAAVQKNFTPAHYANLLAQAFALLLIYLWETDDAALLEAHTFELRAAWAMLLSTMASLIAIVIDLNTPVSNIITMVRKYQVDMDEMIYYGLAKDLAMMMMEEEGYDTVTPYYNREMATTGGADMVAKAMVNGDEEPASK